MRFDCRILLAEDNLVNQKVAAKMLDKLGVNYEISVNGAQALELLQQETFDLVLMDLQMPEVDGLSATQQLRGGDKNAEVPVIALTAHATKEHRKRCFEAGMSDFLTKPATPWMNSGSCCKNGFRPNAAARDSTVTTGSGFCRADRLWSDYQVGGPHYAHFQNPATSVEPFHSAPSHTTHR